MADKTGIQWTDATWNPVTGCSKVSPGCAHCYAEGVADRFWSRQYVHTVERGFIPVNAYAGDAMDGVVRAFTDVMCHPERLDQPLHWRKPRKVFVNSMSDLFHEDVPDAFIDEVFGTMFEANRHTFQILTKRSERMLDYMKTRTERYCEPLPNVWLGVSVENQHFADARIPLLLSTPAAVRFVSYEPALSSVDFVREGRMWLGGSGNPRGLDWVIVGGESGAGARPFYVAWARHVIDQCKEADVAVFVKQLGAVPVIDEARMSGPLAIEEQHLIDRQWPSHVTFGNKTNDSRLNGRCVFLRDGHGGEINEWPVDLRVRDYPHVVTT